MVRRRKAPSPIWRAVLRNHMEDPAAGVFVVASATFALIGPVPTLCWDGADNVKLCRFHVLPHQGSGTPTQRGQPGHQIGVPELWT